MTFSGEFEANSKTFSAKNFAINDYWSDTNPGVSFQPKPPEDEQIEPKALKHKLPEASEKLCKFYLNSGKCPKKSCKYLPYFCVFNCTSESFSSTEKQNWICEHSFDSHSYYAKHNFRSVSRVIQ